MKKSIIALGLLVTGISNAQSELVGINTNNPKTTLDISAYRDVNGVLASTEAVGLMVPRVSREEITSKEAIYTEEQIGAIIFLNDISAGDTNASRVEMTSTGYYVLSNTDTGLLWRKIFTRDEYENIYITDDEIVSNRTVTQADKSLTFQSDNGGKVVIENTTATPTSQVTPLKIIDGGQAKHKALFSDANGEATWQYLAPYSVVGKVYANNKNYNAADKVWLVGSGDYVTKITLPPGKWLVIAGTTFDMRSGSSSISSNTFANSYDSGYVVEFFLSDDDSEGASSIQANITQDAEALPSGDKKTLFSANVPMWVSSNYGHGQQLIHNTSTSEKTYYLKLFIDSNSKYQSNSATVVPNIGSAAGTEVYVYKPFGSVGEKVLYAVKMEDAK